MKRTTILWLLLCLGSASVGYWASNWLSRNEVNEANEAKARFASGLSWAIETGLLTVNRERLQELDAGATPLPRPQP